MYSKLIPYTVFEFALDSTIPLVMNIESKDQYFIVTFANSPNTCIYVINPINACIVSYCVLNVSHIQDIYCIDCDIHIIYNLSEDKRLQFSKILFLTREECLKVLIENNVFRNAANFVIKSHPVFQWKLRSKSN